MGRDSNKPHGIIDAENAVTTTVSDKLWKEVISYRAKILKIIADKGKLSEEDMQPFVDLMIGEDSTFGLPLQDVADKLEIWKTFYEKEIPHIMSVLDDLRSAICTPERVALIRPKFIIITENAGNLLDRDDSLQIHSFGATPSEVIGMLNVGEMAMKGKIVERSERRMMLSPAEIFEKIFNSAPGHPEDEMPPSETIN